MYEIGKGSSVAGGQQPLSGHSSMGTSITIKRPPTPYNMVDQGNSESPLQRPLDPIKIGWQSRRRRGATILDEFTVYFRLTPIYGQEGGPTWPKFAGVNAEKSQVRYATPEVVVLGALPNPDAFPEFAEFHQRLVTDFSALEQNYGGGAIFDVAAIEDDNYIVVVVNTEQADIAADLEAYSQEAKQLFDAAMSMPLPGSSATVPPDLNQQFDPDAEIDPGFNTDPPRSSVTSSGQTIPAPATDGDVGEPKKFPFVPVILGALALGVAFWAVSTKRLT